MGQLITKKLVRCLTRGCGHATVFDGAYYATIKFEKDSLMTNMFYQKLFAISGDVHSPSRSAPVG